MWAHQNFGGQVPLTDPALRRPHYDGVRLATGLVFNFGGAPEASGGGGLHHRPHRSHGWRAAACDGGRQQLQPQAHRSPTPGRAPAARSKAKTPAPRSTPTASAPGSYTATATVTDAKSKKNNTASCTAPFTVKPLNPPQISCSASPSTVQAAGTSSTITCTCTSPDNATVTVGGWTATGAASRAAATPPRSTTAGRCPSVPVTRQRHLYRFARLDGFDLELGDGENPPPPPPPPPQATQGERMRVSERQEAVAR